MSQGIIRFAVRESLEVMVRAHFTARGAVDLAHAVLDEGVTGFRQPP